MFDFAQWCENKGYAIITQDGTVYWSEAVINKGKKIACKEKTSGEVRKFTDDLSDDYKGFSAKNGTVWPFKVLPAKGRAKSTAPVGR